MDNYRRQSPFSTMSLVVGVLSIATIITAILPFPLGALGILFAVLSHRKGQEMDSSAKTGLTTSIVGLSLAFVVMVGVIVNLPTLLKDPQYRDYLNKVAEQTYGQSFDEMVKEGYGIDLDQLFPVEK